MYRSVGEFVAALEAAGELRRVKARVSPVLEVAAIADIVSKSAAANPPSGSALHTDPGFNDKGGHALLFEQIEGSEFPLLINAYGSYKRMEMALGCHNAGHSPGGFDALGDKIGSLVKPQPPNGLRELLAKAKQFLPLLKIPPKRKGGRGPCQEVIKTGDAADLTTLPILRCWPLDGDLAAVGYPAGVNDGIPGLGSGPEWEAKFRGRYITLAGIHTIHADDEQTAKPPSHNIGMYRVQLLGKQRAAMHWHMHHDGARHWRSWKAKGRKMPVAIVLGGESVLPYAATAPLPPGISELLLAGFLNRGGIPLVRGVTVPLWVPANAEIVIEGYVSDEAGFINYDPRTGEPLGPGAVFEGPFGDHTGFYSMPDRYPIVEVTAITHRRNAVYPTTIVGLPPQEDYYLGKATERLFLPLLKTIVHDVEDYDLPMYGAFHNCAAIKIKKAYPLQARRMMHSVWGAGQMAWTKNIFVVDADCEVHDAAAVLKRAAEWCDPARDIESVRGPLDILDHAAPHLGAGTKIGFDCTRKVAGEEVGGVRTTGPRALSSQDGAAEYLRSVSRIAGVTACSMPGALGLGWLLVSVKKQNGLTPSSVLDEVFTIGPSGPPFIVIVDDAVDVNDWNAVLFSWCANADAGRDLRRSSSGSQVGFDATRKSPGEQGLVGKEPVRSWPPMIEMDPGVTAKVRERWSELGLG